MADKKSNLTSYDRKFIASLIVFAKYESCDFGYKLYSGFTIMKKQ